MNNKDQRIAMVHLCNWGSHTAIMSRKGLWFKVHDDNISAGDFVVVESFLPMSTHRVLVVGYVSKITSVKIEGIDIPSLNVMSRVLASGQVFKKPIFEDEYKG